MKRIEIEEKIAELQAQLTVMTKYGDDVHPVGTILSATFVQPNPNVDSEEPGRPYVVYLKISDVMWATTAHSYFVGWEEIMVEINETLKRNPKFTLESLRIIGPKVGNVLK